MPRCAKFSQVGVQIVYAPVLTWGMLMPAKVRELRRKAALCRRAASIPTSGSSNADRILVALAEQLDTMPCSVSANCKRTYPNHPPIGDQRCLSDGGVRSSSGATPALDIGDRQEQGWTERRETGIAEKHGMYLP